MDWAGPEFELSRGLECFLADILDGNSLAEAIIARSLVSVFLVALFPWQLCAPGFVCWASLVDTLEDLDDDLGRVALLRGEEADGRGSGCCPPPPPRPGEISSL